MKIEGSSDNSKNSTAYEKQLMKALGADSIEEAMQIVNAAGIKPEDVQGLLMS